jgi:TPR repeat protein
MDELRKKYQAYKSGEIKSAETETKSAPAKGTPDEEKIKEAFKLHDEKRFDEAAKIFKELAEKGNADAQYGYGLCFMEGIGVKKTEANAVKWWEKAAKNGNADAAFNLGLGYKRRELGLKKNMTKAFKYFLLSAENGNLLAYYYAVQFYMTGEGVWKNIKKGKECMIKAEVDTDAATQYSLGLGYLYKQFEFDLDHAKGIELLTRSAQQGYIHAEYILGNCYRDGEGVEKERVKAIGWYRKAAQKGFKHANTGLKVFAPLSSWYLLYSFCNFWDDIETAVKSADHYAQDADNGDAQAQYYLGICYANGEGVQKDDAKAFEWTQKVAQQGYAKAQVNLGVLYYQGDGIGQNTEKADEWFAKASQQGDKTAQENYKNIFNYEARKFYSDGRLFPKYQEEIEGHIKCITKAAERGNANAQYTLVVRKG